MKKIFVLLLFIGSFTSSFSQDAKVLDSCCKNNIVPYYHIDSPLHYKDGFYALKLFITENYIKTDFSKISNNSGIVVIHFKVTCDGIVKNITHECFDYDYNVIDLNPSIIEVLEKSVAELKNWKIGLNENKEPLCYHKFLAFKLQQGQIIEILPN